MRCRSMTVCLDNSAGSSRRLEFAIALAAQHDAHLTGLHQTYAPLVPDPYGYGEIVSLVAEWEASAKESQERAEAAFRTAAQMAGINFDWAGYRSSEPQRVIAHARSSDLAIIGQRDPPAVDTSDAGKGFNESFVLQLGRPVLYLPYAGNIPKTFDNIIVAWDGGREAARAMADAMPFLQRARQVQVLTIFENKDRGNDLPDVDIAAYLARHEVQVQIDKTENIDVKPGDWLLSRAADDGADLLVMGAYGHSRWSELVLGGVTHTVLREMTLPVLMSH